MNGDFYGRNCLRAYPLDDAATARDDAGTPLPPDILVDCSLRFPASLATSAYLSAVTVSPRAVTLVFAGQRRRVRPSLLADAPPADAFIPLCAVTVTPPFTPFEPLPVDPEADGVAGWVVLGPGLDLPYAGRFSTLEQGALLPRCARAYPDPSISAVYRGGSTGELRGVVGLLGGTDLQVAIVQATVAGHSGSTILVQLRGDTSSNALAAYVGPCGARPESGNCVPAPIERINDATPDAAGNIQVIFQGMDVYPIGTAGGLALDVPLTLDDICGARATPGTPTVDAADGCGDHIIFGPSPPPLTVVSGAFGSADDGYTAMSPGVSLAVKSRSPTPRLYRVRFMATIFPVGVGTPNAAGVAFAYQSGDGTYVAVYADLANQQLVLARGGPGGVVLAQGPLASSLFAAEIPRSVPLRAELELRVMIGETTSDLLMAVPPDRKLPVTAVLEGIVAGAVTGTVARSDGQYGVYAVGAYTTFERLDAEDDPSAS